MTSETSIHLAARHSVQSVKDVISVEPQAFKSKDEDGRIAIHHAVTARRKDVVEYLLSLESPLEQGDESGWLPIHIASSLGELEILKMLLEKAPTSVNAKTESGNTALHYSSAKNQFKCVSLLMEFGADATIRDKLGQTALHRASALGYLPIVEAIVSKFPNILDYQDREKNTPLHFAMEEGRVDVIAFLIEMGANEKIENGDKKIPAQLAQPPILAHLQERFQSNILDVPNF